MKKLTWILPLLLLLSCKKDNDPRDLRLLRVETTTYSGDIITTEYQYDNPGRIIGITSRKNNESPVTLVGVAYTGNEVWMVSSAEYDPSFTETKEVRFTTDASGKPQKRIEYLQRVSKAPSTSREYRYDTAMYVYDAAGLLKNITRVRRDSIWIRQDLIIKRKFDWTINYTNSGGNLVARDEYVTYPITRIENGVTTLSGGSSEYHQVYGYAKGFPNKTDFNNSIVKDEYPVFVYDTPLNSNYKNMHDQVAIDNTDRDLSGTIIFNSKGTIYMDRAYDKKGFLATMTKPPGNTQDIKISYIYGKK